MKQLALFENIQKNKLEKKKISEIIKEALQNSTALSQLNEQYQEIKKKITLAKKAIIEEYQAEADKIDDINAELENDKMVLTDVTLSMMMNGELINITDSKGIEWEPIFSVKYKKVK